MHLPAWDRLPSDDGARAATDRVARGAGVGGGAYAETVPPSSPSPSILGSARAELAALAEGHPSVHRHLAERLLPVGADARDAAVLILFGMLDALPSDHDAQARAVSRDLDVLLLARASTLRSHPGQVAFPGGRVDPGDNGPIAAALREAQEETGLDPAGVDVLGTLEAIPLAHSQHLVTPVIGWWRQPSPVRVVDVAESADVFRAPVADLLNPANRGVTVIRREGQEWRSPGFLVGYVDDDGATGQHLVWGFTAMLLDALFDQLGWTEAWDETRELPLPAAVTAATQQNAAGSMRLGGAADADTATATAADAGATGSDADADAGAATAADAAAPDADAGVREIRVSAAVIHDAEGRLLLVRKAGTTAFMQPGGKPEPGETPAETLARELEEELGLRCAASTLRSLGKFRASAANEPGFVVVADVFEAEIGEQIPVAAAEIAELRWVGADEADEFDVAPLAREYFLPAAPT